MSRLLRKCINPLVSSDETLRQCMPRHEEGDRILRQRMARSGQGDENQNLYLSQEVCRLSRGKVDDVKETT